MTRFDPSSHPRDTTGQFAAKRTAPNPALLHQLEAQAGDDPAARRALVERLCGQLIESPAEFLVSTGGGRLFVEVAAPVDGHGDGCLDCDTQTNGPSFTALDDRTGDILGAYGAQCGGCGAVGAGWVCSGAVEVDVSDPGAFEAAVGDLLDTVNTEAARRRSDAAPTVAAARSAALRELAAADIETVADLALFPPDPDALGGAYYDSDTGEFGCWLPGLAAEDGLDTCWWTNIRSDDDLADLLTGLADDPDVRWVAAGTPATPPDTLTALAADPDSDVRRVVARNPNTPAETLTALAADNNHWVRRYVAANPSTPPDALTVLAADPDPDVRECVVDNPNLPAAGKAAGGLLA